MASTQGGIALDHIERMTWDQLEEWHEEAKRLNRGR